MNLRSFSLEQGDPFGCMTYYSYIHNHRKQILSKYVMEAMAII